MERHASASGVLLVNLEIEDAPLVEVVRIARDRQLTIVLDPAPARELSSAILEAGPILLPNEIEATSLSGESDPDRAGLALARRTRSPVVVKLGPRGALLVDGDEVEAFSAPVMDAVDATGAGDTMAGVLATELASGRPLREALRWAIAAAALSVTRSGAREGMPDRARLETFLAEP